jgi:hypothetical protein
MDVRTGEADKTWYRTDRIFWSGEGWYFLTREQTQEGPFKTREEAGRELNYYIRHMNEWGHIKEA